MPTCWGRATAGARLAALAALLLPLLAVVGGVAHGEAKRVSPTSTPRPHPPGTVGAHLPAGPMRVYEGGRQLVWTWLQLTPAVLLHLPATGMPCLSATAAGAAGVTPRRLAMQPHDHASSEAAPQHDCAHGCARALEPVCGADGRTYASACLAACQGAVAVQAGPCAGAWSQAAPCACPTCGHAPPHPRPLVAASTPYPPPPHSHTP